MIEATLQTLHLFSGKFYRYASRRSGAKNLTARARSFAALRMTQTFWIANARRASLEAV
jgi:hypothetical protein